MIEGFLHKKGPGSDSDMRFVKVVFMTGNLRLGQNKWELVVRCDEVLMMIKSGDWNIPIKADANSK